MDKVKLTQLQADVLEAMKAKGATLNEIVERQVDGDYLEVNNYGEVAKLSVDTLIRALYIGYEVEQTPEDKVRQTFEYALEQIEKLGDHPQVEHWKGLKTGIITTLASLNIKIKGVNDHE